MHQYLDWLLKNQLRALIDRQRNRTLFWVNKLGFLMNKGKSQLVPTHHPAFLGSTIDLLHMVVFPSERREVNVSRLVAAFLTRGPQLAITRQKFLGHLSSLREFVPMVVTHTRPLQLMLHKQWYQATDNPCPDLTEPGDRGQVEMVGGTSQPYGGPTFPLPRSDDDNRNVRLHGGVGGQLGGLRRVVNCLGQAPYQLARAPGCMAVGWC